MESGSFATQYALAAREADELEAGVNGAIANHVLLFRHASAAFDAAVEISKISRLKESPSPVAFVASLVRLDVHLSRVDRLLHNSQISWPKQPGIAFSWKAGDSALEVAIAFARLINSAVTWARGEVRVHETTSYDALPAYPEPHQRFFEWQQRAIKELHERSLPPVPEWPMWQIHRDSARHQSLMRAEMEEVQSRLAAIDETWLRNDLEAAILQRLDEPISFSFDSNRLCDVLDYFRNVAGVNMVVNWPALAAVGVEEDTPVSVSLSNVPARTGLQVVLDIAGAGTEFDPIGFAIADGLLIVSTLRELMRKTTTRCYRPKWVDNELVPREERLFLLEQLRQTIIDSVGTPLEWQAYGGDVSSIQEVGGTLVVRTSAANHAVITELIRTIEPVSLGITAAKTNTLAPSVGPNLSKTPRFLVALSFPGEHRPYVLEVATQLEATLGRNRVLYDDFHRAELARVDLDTYLQRLYHDESALLVVFLCSDYEKKEWCHLEWRAIRDLIKRRQSDVMFLRFDDAEVPGVYSIDGYIDLRQIPPQEAATLVLQRLEQQNV